MMAENIRRREFIGGLAALSMAAKVPGARGQGQKSNGEMEYRTLGKTGVKVSAIGLGGFHLGLSHLEESDAIKIFHAAIDRGINFSDNSWDYNQGVSEKRVGKALKGGYRDKVFVMTKFDGRTKGSAFKQLEESLQRLEVDHVDLWQFHENIRLEDPDRFFAEGGAVEAMQEAKKAGKVRFVGFTGHKDPSVHLRMLEMADKHGFSFDTAQMPLNVMDAHFRSFGREVVPVLVKKQIIRTIQDHSGVRFHSQPSGVAGIRGAILISWHRAASTRPSSKGGRDSTGRIGRAYTDSWIHRLVNGSNTLAGRGSTSLGLRPCWRASWGSLAKSNLVFS